MTIYLTSKDLLWLVDFLVVGPVRDVGLIESTAQRPATDVMGHEPYPTIADKAAALLHSLVSNHPLGDGNKRLAWAATVIFLDINGYTVVMDDDTAYELVIGAAAGELVVAEIARVLQTRVAAGTRDRDGCES